MADEHVPPQNTNVDVVVLGGGIAGISTAVHLLSQGYTVTLVESRQFLGGRAFSFSDGQTGIAVDNGQHVIVGACTHFIELLHRLGIWDRWLLQPHMRIRVLDRNMKKGSLSTSFLPSPFHLLPSFLAYAHLSLGDKVRIVWALICAKSTDRHQPHLEDTTFHQWLKEHGQSDRAIHNFWTLVMLPILNDRVETVSATMGLMVIQEGMLQDYHSADMGYATRDLNAALGEPAKEYLQGQGCNIIFGCSVRKLILNSGRVTGIELASGETVTGQVFVSALPFSHLLAILPPKTAEMPVFQNLKGLKTSPIVNVHIWYDRPVMEGDFCAFVDSPLQWVFNRTAFIQDASSAAGNARHEVSEGTPSQGQYICISHSGAWKYIEWSREDLIKEFVYEMRRVFPSARDAQVQRAIVVKQRNATFRCLPGANELRPNSQTPIPNLFLAGAWTNTGWPSTMEGAARSGYNATKAVMESACLTVNDKDTSSPVPPRI